MKFKIKPWGHQLKAIHIAAPLPEFALLMDMGTGKTATTINILRAKYYEHKRVLRTLILCPIVVCENWRREFELHSNVAGRVVVLTGTAKQRIKLWQEAIAKHGTVIAIMNYEGLGISTLYTLMQAYKFEAIVCDESQRIKNPRAKRTAAAIKLADMAAYKYILSGTPILNNPMDIFSQYRFLDGGRTFGANFFSFRAKYFVDKNAGMPRDKYFPNWQPHPDTDQNFNRLIYKKAMRVMKDECLDLPPFVKTRVDVALSPAQNRVYADMMRQFISFIEDKACVAELAVTKSLRLQQIISGFARLDEKQQLQKYGVDVKTKEMEVHRFDDVPRMSALIEVIEGLPKDAKFIVWACFRENYSMILEAMSKLGISCVSLVGGLSDKERNASIDSFQNNPLMRGMVANQGAGGVGVNLTAASYSLYYSRSFNLEHDLQSEARNYRGGSEIHKKITRIDIVAPGTIDELILDSLHNKHSMAEAILAWREALT